MNSNGELTNSAITNLSSSNLGLGNSRSNKMNTTNLTNVNPLLFTLPASSSPGGHASDKSYNSSGLVMMMRREEHPDWRR